MINANTDLCIALFIPGLGGGRRVKLGGGRVKAWGEAYQYIVLKHGFQAFLRQGIAASSPKLPPLPKKSKKRKRPQNKQAIVAKNSKRRRMNAGKKKKKKPINKGN